MSRKGGRKKRKCCLTCAIINLVILVIFFATLFIGGSIMFKQYVSPYIGGLGLSDALALLGNVMSGSDTEANYTEADLDSFYSELSDAMFLSDKSTEELQYELVPEEKRAELAGDSSVAAAEEEGSSDTGDRAYAAFLLKSNSQRYEYLTTETKAKLSLEEFSSLGGTSDEAAAARDKVGLKTYRLSISKLLGDIDFDEKDFDAEKAVEKSLDSLEFNFDVLQSYDINDPDAVGNEKFTTFSVKGPQVSAFINDLLGALISKEDSSLTSSIRESIPEEVDLQPFFKVASVTIMNTPLATKGEEAAFDQKDTALGVSIVLKVRDLVKEVMQVDDVKKNLEGAPDFAINMIPKLVPQYFSLHATVFPLAPKEDKRELVIMVNKKSDKNAERLSILLNALLSDDGEDASETFLGGINNEIAKAFSSINETVKINFVPSKDKDGNALKDEKGNSYSEMKIMTWETMLSLLDKDGKLSAHDVFTMLKCLYVSTDRPSEIALDGKMDAFKSEISRKYGVKKDFLDNTEIDPDSYADILDNIDLKNLDYNETNFENLRVNLSAEALVAFLTKMFKEEDKGNDSTAAAEDFEIGDLLENADLKVCGIEIKKVSEKNGVKIFSFEMIFSADLSEMLKDKLPTEGAASTLSAKILPQKSTYFGIMLYLSEYTEDGVLKHKIGKEIDSPAEGVASKYESKLRLNDFGYDEMTRVYDAINNFMEVVSGSPFDIAEITASVEENLSKALNELTEGDLKMELRFYEASKNDKGGVTLPCLYELIESIVEPKLDKEKGETFTAEDAFTMLQCLYVSTDRPAELALDAKMDEFKAEMASKYGVKQSYLDESNILSADDLGGMIDNIDLKTVNYAEEDYDKMKVDLSAEALASFVKTMLSDDKADVSALVAAAEEDDLLKKLNPTIRGIEIKQVSEKDGVKIFTLELIFSTDLNTLLKDKFDEEGSSGNLSRNLLPAEETYLGVLLYLSEYTNEEGKLLHKVGKAIDDPAEGEESQYLSKLRINDYSYEDMERVYAALNTVLKALAQTEFKITDILDKVEETFSEVLDDLANNDFKLDMRLYAAEGNGRGGIRLPSIYELIASIVEPNLDKETESFGKEDAKDVLRLMYEKEISLEKAFAESQGDDFLDEINDKFYIKKDSALSADDLFGDDTSDLASSISASSIYFKPSAAEELKWKQEKGETFVKKSLYTDTRSAYDLRAALSGSQLAALIKSSGLLPDDMIGSFGEMEILGASFNTEDQKTYLTFDLKLVFNKESDGNKEAIEYGSLVPDAIKLSATVLLYAKEYAEGEPQYSVTVKINEDSATKIFLLMRALGSEDLSKETIEEKIRDSISQAFEDLSAVIPLYYFNAESGDPYTVNGEQCLRIADVFTFLVKETEMKDDPDSDVLTDPDALASRLRKFGEQAQNIQGWMDNVLKPFDDEDDDYIYRNMELAYFLKTDEENPLTMDSIYGEGNGVFTDKFKTIKEDNFRLSGNDGLYRYDGNILSLKVSDKALGVIVKSKQADSFSGAVTGDGMTVDFVSLKLRKDDNGDLVLESGVKIAFGEDEAYNMMPDYFYVIAKTVRHTGVFTTTISLNTAGSDATDMLFKNILSLKDKGLDASTFDKDKISQTLNDAIETALSKFPDTVVFNNFTDEELNAEYASGYESKAGGSLALPEEGDGYIGFPSVYSYLIDFFYTADKPTEKQMQHMLNSLHSDSVESEIVTNPMNSNAYRAKTVDFEHNQFAPVYKGSSPLSAAFVISDRYLAYEINRRLSTDSLEGDNLSLNNAIKQVSILGRGTLITGEKATWEGKFLNMVSYAEGHDYLITTACLSLAAYNTGDKASLLPTNLWFTVLADMSNADESKGLLYNMNQEDMEIFEHVLKASGFDSFGINNIAREFTTKIKDALDALSDSIPGFLNLKITYKFAEEEFVFYDDYSDTSDNKKRYASAYVQAEMEDDKPNGVGYVVLSLS